MLDNQRPIGGDWADYARDVANAIKKYKPRSVLELGCGAFVGAQAWLAFNDVKRYVGVDRHIDPEMQSWLVRALPGVSFTFTESDVFDYEVNETFDAVVIDAHDGDEESYARQHERQIVLAERAKAWLYVVDDCRIPMVAKVHVNAWGEPTQKGEGVTGLWTWDRR